MNEKKKTDFMYDTSVRERQRETEGDRDRERQRAFT